MGDGEQLYTLLESMFACDPLIEELGLVVSANPKDHPDANKSPGLPTKHPKHTNGREPFILFNHKLGVAYWCIPLVYKYSIELFRERAKQYRIDDNRDPQVILDLQRTTRNVLLINADCYTVLNVRKQMILDKHITREEEIKLLNLIFTKHPKSGEAWSHRRWVLASIGKFENSESELSEDAKQFLNTHARGELRVCTRMSEIYPKNYYSWTHRAWVLDHVTNDIILEELEAMVAWTRRNVSDYCGFHHKQYILLKIAERKAHENVDTLWRNEFEQATHLILTYPGHEALWCHQRALLFLYSTVIVPSLVSATSDLQALIKRELEFCDERAGDVGEAHHDAQRRFALRYKAFILEIVVPQLSLANIATKEIHLRTLADALASDKMQNIMWQYKIDIVK